MASRYDSKPPELPRWARLSKRKRTDNRTQPVPLSTRQEEAHLRTRTYQAVAQKVDEAVQEVLEQYLGPLATQLHDFFHLVSPSQYSSSNGCHPREEEKDSLQPPISKRPRLDSEDTNDDEAAENRSTPLSSWTIPPPTRYPPTLLPVALLQGPLSTLDRHDAVGRLVHKFRNTSTTQQQRPAVVWLRQLSAGATDIKHAGTLVKEILRQCIAEEAQPERFHKFWTKTKTYAPALVTWAQYTDSFDSILIFLEGVEGLPALVVQDFLQLLTSLRSEDGLPIQLVLVLPPERGQQLHLKSCTQGQEGILVREFGLPSSQVLYDSIWKRLWIEEPLPVVLPSQVLRSIRESFVNHSSSVIDSVLLLKQGLAHHFAQPGSFLCGVGDDTIMKQENRRIRWFCLSSEGRKYTFPKNEDPSLDWKKRVAETSNDRLTTVAVLRILDRLSRNLDKKCPSTIRLAEDSFSKLTYESTMRSKITRLFRLSNEQENLQLLANLRRDISRSKSPRRLHNLSQRLDELVVLVYRHSKCERDQIRWSYLSELFEEWVHEVFTEGAALVAKEEENLDGRQWSVRPEPRRDVANALFAGASAGGDQCVGNYACELFAQMRDCVVIPRNDLFQLFLRTCDRENESTQELWSRFMFGLYQLEHCGLVKEKRGNSKAEPSIEKTALVWCSGD